MPTQFNPGSGKISSADALGRVSHGRIVKMQDCESTSYVSLQEYVNNALSDLRDDLLKNGASSWDVDLAILAFGAKELIL
jgi:hypothetical protein